MRCGALLAREGPAIPVYVGMRNWAPYVSDVMREIAAAKARRIFCFVMAPHRSEASWDRYRDTVAQALAALGSGCARSRLRADDGTTIRCLSARWRRACAKRWKTLGRRRSRLAPEVIFTAHSIPIAMDARSGYCRGNCRVVPAGRARSSGLRDGSSLIRAAAAIRATLARTRYGAGPGGLAGQAAVVMPIGFICDHVEVLYDLDVEAAAIARECGVTMRRAPTVGQPSAVHTDDRRPAAARPRARRVEPQLAHAMKHVAVIGGGIAGLAAAYRLNGVGARARCPPAADAAGALQSARRPASTPCAKTAL